MANIKSKNSRIYSAIEKLLETVKDSGGSVHPALQFCEIAGELTVMVKGSIRRGEIALNIPLSCMPYIEQFDLSMEGSKILLSTKQDLQHESLPAANAAQRSVMTEIVTLYNEAGKVQGFCASSPMIAFGQQEIFRRLVSQRESDFVGRYQECSDLSDLSLQIFLESRIFNDARTSGNWILPVIDFVDHHSMAEAFELGQCGGEEGLILRFSKVGSGRGCYASYSLMDAFHSWLRYAFVDDSAFFVQSIPFSIRLKGGELLNVHALPINNSQLDPALWKAVDNNAYFYAAQFSVNEGVLDVGFMIVPPVSHGRAFTEVIELYLEYFEKLSGVNSGEIRNLPNIQLVRDRLVAENKSFYRELKQLIDEEQAVASDVRTTSYRMLKKQMKIIQSFDKDVRIDRLVRFSNS